MRVENEKIDNILKEYKVDETKLGYNQLSDLLKLKTRNPFIDMGMCYRLLSYKYDCAPNSVRQNIIRVIKNSLLYYYTEEEVIEYLYYQLEIR